MIGRMVELKKRSLRDRVSASDGVEVQQARHPHFDALVKLPEGQLWDRLDKEPERAYRTFCIYRSMPAPRSLTKLAKHLGRKSQRRFEQWSSKWRWVDRVAAYDAEMDKRYQETTAGELERIRAVHKKWAEITRKISLSEMEGIAQRIEAEREESKRTGRPPESVLKPAEIVRYGRIAIEIERLITGQPTEHTKTEEGGFDPSRLSVEELAQLKDLQDKARTKAGIK